MRQSLSRVLLLAVCVALLCGVEGNTAPNFKEIARATGNIFGPLSRSIGDLVRSLDSNDNGLLDMDDAAEMASFFVHDGQALPSKHQLREFLSLWHSRASPSATKSSEDFDPLVDLRHLVAYLEAKAEEMFPASAIEEVHIALTGNPTEMNVKWLTPTKPGSAFVEYRFDGQTGGGNYTQKSTGTWTSYTVDNKELYLLGLGYSYTSWVSTAVITGIPANSVVCYRCSNGTAYSPEYCFNAPQAGPQVASTKFTAMGDQGTVFPVGFEVAAQIAEQVLHDPSPPNFVLHAGDIAYAGTGGREEWEFIWDWLLRQNQQFAAYAPYMTTVGNHEHYYNYTAFTHRFSMPSNGNGNFWYSYNSGLVHVLSIDTEVDYNPGSAQYDFIVDDLQLATSNLDAVPWIVAVMHRPVYCSDVGEWTSHNGDPSTSQLSVALEPVFKKYNVPLVIAGHMHVYERTYPVYNASTSYPAGATTYSTINGSPIYITVGSGGIFLDEQWIEPAPVWSASRGSIWGTAIVTANATTLHYQFETTRDRKIFDECFIVNNVAV